MDPFAPPTARPAPAAATARVRLAATSCLLAGVAVTATGAQLLAGSLAPGPAPSVGVALAGAGALQAVAARRLDAGRGAWLASGLVVATTSFLLAWNAWSLTQGWLSPLAWLAAAVQTPTTAFVVVAAPGVRASGR